MLDNLNVTIMAIEASTHYEEWPHGLRVGLSYDPTTRCHTVRLGLRDWKHHQMVGIHEPVETMMFRVFAAVRELRRAAGKT